MLYPPPLSRLPPVELKFMKNDRRLSSVARKENPHCPDRVRGGKRVGEKERGKRDEREEEAEEKEQA